MPVPMTKKPHACLVVDDSPMMRQLIVFALGRLKNIVVTECDDAIAGLRHLASERYDLVITDINMPVMDGLKLIKRIRGDERHKDVPIVVITTESASEDRDRALALGANAYISKPIQAPQVLETVKQLLRLE
jgi:two-component system chemotaxis response regulator CheY